MAQDTISMQDGKDYRGSTENGRRLLPNDFDEYLPWACKQLEVKKMVIVKKVIQDEYESIYQPRGYKEGRRHKMVKSQTSFTMRSSYTEKFRHASLSSIMDTKGKYVMIDAVYCGNHLVHIKFNKDNAAIPAAVLTIIGYIVQFHPHINKLTINNGLSVGVMKAVAHLMTLSNITEIVLDDCCLNDSICHILLGYLHNLFLLSLARCQITDNMIRMLSENLVYPLPSSKKLSILNLQSNNITDMGVSHIAHALRTNRRLQYLNLADNVLTDKGVEFILESLREFPLTYEETVEVGYRQIEYAKEKNEIILKLIAEMKTSGEYDRIKKLRSQTNKLITQKRKKSINTAPVLSSTAEIDAYFHTKAVNVARDLYGEFEDPFSKSNVVSKDGLLYSNGNNTLCYLNLAYNDISYFSLKLIIVVLTHQNVTRRSPVGLLNLRLEGNPMPKQCRELQDIDELLGERLLPVVKKIISRKLFSSKSK